jgi:hypothetical protein
MPPPPNLHVSWRTLAQGGALSRTRAARLARSTPLAVLTPGSGAPTSQVWGYDNLVAAVLPFAFGTVGGFLAVIFAMVLSRTRAERRDAMAADVPLKRYKMSSRKQLTGPTPVLRDPPANPAMLNPVLESGFTPNFTPGYASNYPAGGTLGRVDSL